LITLCCYGNSSYWNTTLTSFSLVCCIPTILFFASIGTLFGYYYCGLSSIDYISHCWLFATKDLQFLTSLVSYLGTIGMLWCMTLRAFITFLLPFSTCIASKPYSSWSFACSNCLYKLMVTFLDILHTMYSQTNLLN
jgi:hypothetical protein